MEVPSSTVPASEQLKGQIDKFTFRPRKGHFYIKKINDGLEPADEEVITVHCDESR